MLLERLKSKAVAMGLLQSDEEIDAATAYALVRDMPYQRASSRDAERIIAEWRGTCSGKHYLLKALFAELGYSSRVILCTTETRFDLQQVHEAMRDLVIRSNGRFVDAHNYLMLELPGGEMIVDATWPLSTKGTGTIVNEQFVLGQNQAIAAEPLRSWDVPEDGDPQAFKDEILRAAFTAQELEDREEYIRLIAQLLKERAARASSDR